MTSVTLDDIVVQNAAILAAVAGSEVLAMDENSGNCFALGGSGRLIWQAAEAPISVRDICAQLRRHYKVDEATCAAQTLAYVDSLLAEGVLLIASPRD